MFGHFWKGRASSPMTGRHHSPKTVAKMSAGKEGALNPMYGKRYRHTPEAIANMSRAKKGKPNLALRGYRRSPEVRAKMSASFKGRPHPLQSGRYHYNWNPNKQHSYPAGWSAAKKRIRIRDSGECQNPRCNGTSSKRDAHHINYNKQDCRGSNLILLCASCHQKMNCKNTRFYYFVTYSRIARSRELLMEIK